MLQEKAKFYSVESDEYFEVEKIVDKKYDPIDRQTKYKVKWMGYPDEECTWEPYENLGNAKDCIKEFEDSLNGKSVNSTPVILKTKNYMMINPTSLSRRYQNDVVRKTSKPKSQDEKDICQENGSWVNKVFSIPEKKVPRSETAEHQLKKRDANMIVNVDQKSIANRESKGNSGESSNILTKFLKSNLGESNSNNLNEGMGQKCSLFSQLLSVKQESGQYVEKIDEEFLIIKRDGQKKNQTDKKQQSLENSEKNDVLKYEKRSKQKVYIMIADEDEDWNQLKRSRETINSMGKERQKKSEQKRSLNEKEKRRRLNKKKRRRERRKEQKEKEKRNQKDREKETERDIERQKILDKTIGEQLREKAKRTIKSIEGSIVPEEENLLRHNKDAKAKENGKIKEETVTEGNNSQANRQKEKEKEKEKTAFKKILHSKSQPEFAIALNEKVYYQTLASEYLDKKIDKVTFLELLSPEGNFKDDEIEDIMCMNWRERATANLHDYYFKVVWKPTKNGIQKGCRYVSWQEFLEEKPTKVAEFGFQKLLGVISKYGTFNEL